MADQFNSMLAQLGEKWGLSLRLDQQNAAKLTDRHGAVWQLEYYPETGSFTFSGVIDCQIHSEEDYSFWLGLNRERDLMGYSYISVEDGLVHLECTLPADVLDAQQLGNLLENMSGLMVELVDYGAKGTLARSVPLQNGAGQTDGALMFLEV
ncbi:type III secretion system chaperone [Pseudovibrio denitrificans]|uniref:type III secretion system chaperone n=1 Tax=Pseudovibrio denitrificans TaxID=258256 RepID=UPI0039BF6054